VYVRVEAEVRPTESLAKVRRAILNVFDADSVRVVERPGGRLLVAESRRMESLLRLHDLLRRERILDAARSHLLRGLGDGVLVFRLNKQVAYVGHLSFVDDDVESPLGPIVFIVESGRVREIVDWLAPPTRLGRPVYERSMPRD